jgi:uncharacterized protein YndB with AHSA1/START domain
MKDIVISRTLPFQRELVWDALTDSVQLAAWLMPNDFEPVLGHRFTFKTDPAPGFDGIVACEVLEIVPLERLVMSWRGGPLDTILSIELTDSGTGTRLELRHSGFQGLSNLIPRIILGFGWASNVDKKLVEILLAKGR